MQISKRQLSLLVSSIVFSIAGVAHAHGPGHHPSATSPAMAEQKAWGIAGDTRAATRTIEVLMHDSMRFEPSHVKVRLGETVRFVHRNRGRLMHEFVLGTRAGNEKHAAMMAGHPGMAHDEPHVSHVAPGKSAETVWTFNRAGSFEFACLVAGHYQAGMSGMVHVSTAGDE